MSKTGIPRFITELLASLDFKWDALSQKESASVRDHTLFGSLMLVLTRLSLTDCGWTTLAELAIPEIMDVVHSQSELLSQLMRADITCPMIELSATLIQEVWENDETTRLIIDGDSVLKQLKNRDRLVKTNSNSSGGKGQPLHESNSFNAPSRLIPDTTS
uniref:Transposase n=1 Tax=Heterorhabditis bacteriophora TaxID=37862 RepID=A0A1I7XTQ1_HETBA